MVALVARPPWTVHTILHYSTGHEEPYHTVTVLRSFLAPPEWEIYRPPNAEPIALKFTGTLRFDLLGFEVAVLSMPAAGLVLVTRPRAK